MKSKNLLLSIMMLLVISVASFSQQRQQISFEDLMLNAELDYMNVIESRIAALNTGAPINIYLEEGIFIEAKGVENGKPVYAVIRDLLHPAENSDVMFYEEVLLSFDIESARVNYGDGRIANPSVGMAQVNPRAENSAINYLLVSESSNNSVMLFDFATGDLVKPDFVPPQTILSLPKQARQSPRTTISISDQTEDVVFDYDTLGSVMGIFAPSIGPHTGILDNIRGHNYNPNNNHLVVCNAQGGNFNRIVEFDTMGNYLGHFIADNSGGLLDPFDIIFRATDVFVTGATSSAVHRYDYDGNYLDDFATGILFPQQMVEFPNGDIGIASFGSSGGLKIYGANGNLLNEFTSVSWLRGVHYLGSGNIIVTNSAGVHEINGTTGDFIRTIVAGVSAQYVSSCDLSFGFTPVAIGVEINIPTAFVLSQNYPNPFNPSTTIEYQIPSNGFVSLTIYNSRGQVVSSLVNEYQTAGKYRVSFHSESVSSGLPSGLYFYSLRAGDFKETRKMMLLK